jgi:predicted ABC-type ATPase
MRMFAGPNGSGKSTIKDVVPAGLLGVYLFDNSQQGGDHRRKNLEIKCDPMPRWFEKAIWSQI